MKMPSHAEAFELLCLLAADEGRGPVLFGSSLDRVRAVLPPFMAGKAFPNVYLEFPLAGEPFLDVNVGYVELDEGDFAESVYTHGTEELFEWYVQARRDYPDIAYGYVLDTNKLDLVSAGVYFQPRAHDELIVPFCQAAGEPERASLYLGLASRMPQEWPLSYLGMFRGRAKFPLRVGGYLQKDGAAFDDTGYLAEVFERIGFAAYDEQMLCQIAELMKAAPDTVDFQLDVLPDGTLSDVFSLELKFNIANAEGIRASFRDGAGARIMSLLENWGIADERWKLGIDAAIARTVPVELPDGTKTRCMFIVLPQWVKVRWKGAVLQPAKLYHVVCAGPI